MKPHVQQSYNSNLRYLEAKWNRFTLLAMLSEPAKIEDWLNNLTSYKFPRQPLSRSSRTHIRMLLHHMIDCGMRWGLLECQPNPASTIRVIRGSRPKPRELTLSPNDFENLIVDPKLPEHVVVMCYTAIMTGGSISRVLGMRWNDSVDFEHRIISFRRSVVGNYIDEISRYDPENEVPMHDVLAEVLRSWKTSRTIVNGWLFGSKITGRPFNAMTLQGDYLKPAGERLDLIGLGWQTFRYSFRKYLNKLETVEAVQETLASDLTVIQKGRKRGALSA